MVFLSSINYLLLFFVQAMKKFKVLCLGIFIFVGYSHFFRFSIKEDHETPKSLTTRDSKPSAPCAIAFYGALRSFENKALATIQKNLLSVNPDCKIYAHTYALIDLTAPRNHEFHEKYSTQEIFLLTQNVGIDTKLEFEKNVDPEQYYKYFPQRSGWDYPTSLYNMLMAWYSVQRVWRMIEADNIKYDHVGMFRLDTLYPVPIAIRRDSLFHVPIVNTFDDHSFNDRMAVGPYEVIKTWANRFEGIEKYMHSSIGNHWGLRSENYLYWLMNGVDHVYEPSWCSIRVRATEATNERDVRECDKTYFSQLSTPASPQKTECFNKKKAGSAYFTYNFGNFRNELKKNGKEFQSFTELLHEKHIRCFVFTDVRGLSFKDCHVVTINVDDLGSRFTGKHLKFKFHQVLESFDLLYSSDYSIHSIRSMRKLLEEDVELVIDQNPHASIFIRRHPQRETIEEEIKAIQDLRKEKDPRKRRQYENQENLNVYEKFITASKTTSQKDAPLAWTNVWIIRSSDTCFTAKWARIFDFLIEHKLQRDQLVYPYIFRDVDLEKIFYLRNECETYPYPKIGWCTDTVRQKYYNCYPLICILNALQ